ncbi:MAG TPA: rod shape-determining protein MreD [Chromatiales bacterium]|nr:rod shape-determining protein MreD [Thiotrichales bacterium]HIP68562.1 rod shape-determining protein MreD [Chromatiales bacterium]
MTHPPRKTAIYLTMAAALMLTILPLPEWAAPYRPEWLALVVLYWTMALPKVVNIASAWVLGIIMDLLTGSLLGQHALGLIVLSLITIHLHQQLRNFPIWQQSLVIAIIIAIYLGLILWIEGLQGRAPDTWLYWAPVLSSLLLWPWIFVLLREIRRQYVTGSRH